jgi:hypothetical protein
VAQQLQALATQNMLAEAAATAAPRLAATGREEAVVAVVGPQAAPRLAHQEIMGRLVAVLQAAPKAVAARGEPLLRLAWAALAAAAQERRGVIGRLYL